MTPLAFEISGASAQRYAATPTILLHARVRAAGVAIDALALRIRAQIEPWRRSYRDDEREALRELSRGSPLQLCEVAVMVGRTGPESAFDIPVPCTCDAAVTATKYVVAIEDGEIPLRLFFNGTLFRGGPNGFAVEMLPWNLECQSSIPVRLWREASDACFEGQPWIRIERSTYEALLRYRARHGLHDVGGALAELLRAEHER